jgi:hypothetical protein
MARADDAAGRFLLWAALLALLVALTAPPAGAARDVGLSQAGESRAGH